jgi:hypothetical protein
MLLLAAISWFFLVGQKRGPERVWHLYQILRSLV